METIFAQIDKECTKKIEEIKNYYNNIKNCLISLDYFNLPDTKEIQLEVHYTSENELISNELVEENILNCIVYQMSNSKTFFLGKKLVNIINQQRNKEHIIFQAKLILIKPEINYTNIPQFTRKVKSYIETNSIDTPIYYNQQNNGIIVIN